MAAHGMDSPLLRKGITEREAEISALTAQTLGRAKSSVRTQVRDMRKFVLSNLGDLRALLAAGRQRTGDADGAGEAHHTNHDRARRWNRARSRTGKLVPVRKQLRNRGCAEGQNRTGYAGLFRAALYQ
jgi:hypothetical protein